MREIEADEENLNNEEMKKKVSFKGSDCLNCGEKTIDKNKWLRCENCGSWTCSKCFPLQYVLIWSICVPIAVNFSLKVF